MRVIEPDEGVALRTRRPACPFDLIRFDAETLARHERRIPQRDGAGHERPAASGSDAEQRSTGLIGVGRLRMP
jgi:hypothetical protein